MPQWKTHETSDPGSLGSSAIGSYDLPEGLLSVLPFSETKAKTD